MMDDKEDRLPRGHAYIRFRNKGYSLHIDFPEKEVPWLEYLMKQAMRQFSLQEEKEKRLAEREKRKADARMDRPRDQA